ncbi:hypothetical protein HaLaN_04988, partial [Haematococcus lacustris]
MNMTGLASSQVGALQQQLAEAQHAAAQAGREAAELRQSLRDSAASSSSNNTPQVGTSRSFQPLASPGVPASISLPDRQLVAEVEYLRVQKAQLEAALKAEQHRMNDWLAAHGAAGAAVPQPSAGPSTMQASQLPVSLKASAMSAFSHDKKRDDRLAGAGGIAIELDDWDPESAALQGGSTVT